MKTICEAPVSSKVEVQATGTAYEAGVKFYTRKLETLCEQFEQVEEPDSFEGIQIIEEAEEAELRLKQLERRKSVGLLK